MLAVVERYWEAIETLVSRCGAALRPFAARAREADRFWLLQRTVRSGCGFFARMRYPACTGWGDVLPGIAQRG